MAHQYAYPQFYYPTPYMVPFYNQPYVSPFIPPMTNLPPAPVVPPPPHERRVRFDNDREPFPPRERRPSWHANLAPPPNPVPFPSPPIIVTPLPPVVSLPAQPAAVPVFTHQRRRSDTCLPQPAWVTFPTMVTPMAPAMTFQPSSPHTAQIHPLLNGESAAGPKILFDLSLHSFNPQRITTFGQKSGTPLTLDELLEPATHPPVYRMTIKCDALPEWPVHLSQHTTARERSRERSPFLSVSLREAEDAPITVYDTDWVRLSARRMNEVSAAYTRRCRHFPSPQAFEEAQGVRRVDYLGERYMFCGISREGGPEGFTKMKLAVEGPR
uniref:Non-ribosomal peptide synthetase SyfB n=1 Tax=Ganoderma boninense TaxID=34458 RepID=A0A5K1JSM6_9APHY|nr:Non-ribosomal peptide synthetase SyfB [Ganoderma boninense]